MPQELHPDASYFLTGHPKGHVQLWHLAPPLARLLDQPLPPPTSTSRHDVAAALAAEGGAPVGGAGAVPVVDLTGGVPPPPPLQQQQQQQQGAQEGGEEEGLREGEHYMGLQPVLAVPQPAVSKDQAPIECIRCLPGAHLLESARTPFSSLRRLTCPSVPCCCALPCW